MHEEGFERKIKPHDPEMIPDWEYERIISDSFQMISKNPDGKTGLFPAVDSDIHTPESNEDDMREAWIRDLSWNLISLMETIGNLRDVSPKNEMASRMTAFLKNDIEKVLHFLNQDRWVDKFNQQIIDNGSFTSLSEDPPEVHMKHGGEECHWDQNQPESWGELLLAIGKAGEIGVVEKYSEDQTKVIKSMAAYLIRIQPWKFSGAGMWEGLPAHSPSSRSNAVAIAKGLDAVRGLFQDDPSFQEKIDNTVSRTMAFVKEDINTDYTTPDGHPGGADLAMLATMILPCSEKTELPFAQYVDENKTQLQIGLLPGAIRYVGDAYKRGEFGEARWFMADPILAIGYFKEAENELRKGDKENARIYNELALSRLNQALSISSHYGYDVGLFPELFIPRDPKNVVGRSDILLRNDGTREVALEPLNRSLIWNCALVMHASALANKIDRDSEA